MATKTSNNESLSAENKETDKNTSDEKQAAASDAIDWNEKGLESFNKYIKHIFAEIEKNGGSKKYGFLQLCSVVELLEKCQKSGIIDKNVDLCDIEEDEEEFTKLLNGLTLKSYVDNMEYLVISEKMGKGIEQVSEISCMIVNNYGYENTHTGNCKADQFEKIVKKIQRLMKKQDYESAFGLAMGLTYNCMEETNGNAYWMNDNECPDDIDENILKPMASIWSQLLIKNCQMSSYGCINFYQDKEYGEYRNRKNIISYLKRVKLFIKDSFDFYDSWNVKFPVVKKPKKKKNNNNDDNGVVQKDSKPKENDDPNQEPPKKRRRKSKGESK